MPADATFWNSSWGIFAQLYIWIGNAWNWSIIPLGKRNRIVGIPIKINGAVSPNARDSAKMNPVKIPGKAAGKTTL